MVADGGSIGRDTDEVQHVYAKLRISDASEIGPRSAELHPYSCALEWLARRFRADFLLR